MSSKDLTVSQKDEHYYFVYNRQIKKPNNTILIRASKNEESKERDRMKKKKLNLYKPYYGNEIKFTRIVRNIICIYIKLTFINADKINRMKGFLSRSIRCRKPF